MHMRPGPEADALRAHLARHLQRERARLNEWLPLLAPVFSGSGDDGRLNADDGGYRLRISSPDRSSVLRLRVGYADDSADRDVLDDVLDEQVRRSEEDDTDTAPEHVQLRIVVAGEPVDAKLTRRGAVWSTGFAVPPGTTGMPFEQSELRATLAGWNVDPSAVSLEPVADLTPWFRGMDERVDRSLREPPQPPLPPGSPVGRDAVRALIEQAAGDRLTIQRREPNRAARRRSRAADRVNLWPAATEAVQAATGLDQYDAAARLARVVNQLADVFDTERDLFTPSLRQRAIEESIDHLLTGTAPTIAAVQERAKAAWVLNDELSALMRKRMQADEDLRLAWRQWAATAQS